MEIKNLKDALEFLPAIARWHHDEWVDYNPDLSFEDRLKRMQEHLHDDLVPSTWVAIEAGEVIGSAAIGECDMESHPELSSWLESVFVAPEHRNRGVASKLVSAVMSEAVKENIEMMYLFTPDRQSLYARLGWKVFSEEQYMGHDVTIMSVKL